MQTGIRVGATASVSWGWVVVCLAALLVCADGCSRSDIVDYAGAGDGGPFTDGTALFDSPADGAHPTEGGPAGCNATSCPSGCCDPSGVCLPGAALSACGAAGEACVDCQAQGFQLCNAMLHACGDDVGPQCDNTNCSGCCFGTQCLAGSDPTACGRRGAACGNCTSSGQVCVPNSQAGGSCQTPAACDPQSCASGCCDVRGCRRGMSDNACGGGGGQCQDCTQSGATCNAQQCVAPPPTPVCDPQSCPSGCCDRNGNCQPGTSDRRCGSGGASCTSCARSGGTCNNQQCTPMTACAATCATCCDAAGNCQPGSTDTQCGTFGSSCQDCQQSGQVCIGGSCLPPSACAMSCFGCCDAAGGCHGGYLDSQCGGNGATCQDCTHLSPASTCDLQVFPVACAGPQSACPGTYAGCMAPPPVTTKQQVCPANDLQNAAAACSMGIYASVQCSSFLSFENTQNPACYACLAPFTWDFDQVAGLAACAAPFLDPTCNTQAFCDGDCLTTACFGCAVASAESTCLTQAASGACSAYAQGNTCLSTALAGPAAACSPSTYQGNYGAWLAAVGAMYCGM